MRTLFKFNNIYMHTLFYYFSNLYEMYLKYCSCAIYRDPTVALQLSLFSQGGLFYVILYYHRFKVYELSKI